VRGGQERAVPAQRPASAVLLPTTGKRGVCYKTGLRDQSLTERRLEKLLIYLVHLPADHPRVNRWRNCSGCGDKRLFIQVRVQDNFTRHKAIPQVIPACGRSLGDLELEPRRCAGGLTTTVAVTGTDVDTVTHVEQPVDKACCEEWFSSPLKLGCLRRGGQAAWRE